MSVRNNWFKKSCFSSISSNRPFCHNVVIMVPTVDRLVEALQVALSYFDKSVSK